MAMTVNDPSGRLRVLPTNGIHTDPGRFQARSPFIEDGSDHDLSGVTVFNVDFAGVISVWRDPSDDRIFVVDGHRRLDLACRTRTPQLLVQFLSCSTAGEAFGKGIVISIAKWIFDSDVKVEKACACRRGALERALAERRLDPASKVAEELFEYFPDLRPPESGSDLRDVVLDKGSEAARAVATLRVGEDRLQEDGSHEATLPTDVLFLTLFHKLPWVSDGDHLNYYRPADWDRLRSELTATASHYLSLFSESFYYEDYFSCADYGIDDESFDELEIEVFRSALESERTDRPAHRVTSQGYFQRVLPGYRRSPL
jgi:hypothetical protein